MQLEMVWFIWVRNAIELRQCFGMVVWWRLARKNYRLEYARHSPRTRLVDPTKWLVKNYNKFNYLFTNNLSAFAPACNSTLYKPLLPGCLPCSNIRLLGYSPLNGRWWLRSEFPNNQPHPTWIPMYGEGHANTDRWLWLLIGLCWNCDAGLTRSIAGQKGW